MYPIYTLYNILWLLLSAVAGHGYYTKTCEDELLVEVGTCSVCSCGSGTEHIPGASRRGTMALWHRHTVGLTLP